MGSPGIGVDSPEKLNFTGVQPDNNRNHIYSTTAQYDPIRLTPNIIHGPQPVSNDFGTTFHSDGARGPWYQLGWTSDAHGGYWDKGNPGLATMGNIINGEGTGK
ncbi:hypothetical protein [Nocardia wallacei]|uniref:hypothetical protein n=1 Tax=Nocardia wallacei TaxID=480035 RepID=UPI002455DEC8|nr:hypothetical protein [Nocardia wallacei]